MKILFTTLILFAVNLIYCAPVIKAQIISDPGSTPDAITSFHTQFSAQLQEISFKDTPSDFLIFKVTGPTEKINLKGLRFYDDKDFKIIEDDFIVGNGARIKLIFNSDQKDSPAQSMLFTKQKGLTATTEQIVLKHNNHYLDFFCWQKDPASKSEQIDWENLWQEQYWDENDILSCFDSEKVQTGQVVTRQNDENNSSAWLVKTDQDIASQDQSKTAKIAKKGQTIAPLINNDSELPAQPPLRLTEIFPAPAAGQEEWIELENLTSENLNLNGWIIDDQEGGSKPKRLSSHNLPANGLLALSLKDYKINLNNSSDQVRVFSPSGEIMAMQEYEEAEKGKSYALIVSNEEENWQYLDSPSPGKRNPQLTTIKGVITIPAQFDHIYNFTIQPETNSSSSSAPLLVVFEEKTIKGPLAKTTFVAGAGGQFTGEIIAAPPNNNGYLEILQLETFQIDQLSKNKNSPSITLIGIIVLTGLGVWGGFKFYQHQNFIK